MANKKKPTMNEMKEHVDLMTRQVNFLSRMLDSIGTAFSSYVRYKGDDEGFKNYLENNKNLHKLTKEENEARNKGHNKQDNAVPVKEIRKEGDGETKK